MIPAILILAPLVMAGFCWLTVFISRRDDALQKSIDAAGDAGPETEDASEIELSA